MLISPKVFTDLRFDIIQQKLAEFCHSIHTRALIWELKPSSDLASIYQLQNFTEDLVSAFQRGDTIPLESIPDVQVWVDQIKIEGNLLNPEQFSELKKLLGLTRRIRKNCNSTSYPHWYEICDSLIDLPQGEEEISRIFDDDWTIMSSASPELKRIRKQILALEASIQKRMQELFQKALSSNWLQGDKIVLRDGRLALPMTAAHKRKMQGIVHGHSSTGQTVFVEPLEIIEKNNDLTDLRGQEKAEIHRILQELTAFFRPYHPEIIQSFRILIQFDLHYTFARLASILKCVRPVFCKDGSVGMNNARNPQLALSLKEVIPLNLELPADERILLLSGPNAGGKTVVLKTIGLFVLMSQCGLFLPADEVRLPIFNAMVVDIGDQQSIEDDLSTFSAHVQNLKVIMDTADEHSLVLMDELGTGTDPDAGAAISRALLEQLLVKRCHCVATSHLGSLKLWAHETRGIINGGMKFDPKQLAPTYELTVGRPGASYALEISQRIGLDKVILDRASELIGSSSVKLENLLGELEIQQKKVEKLEEDLRVRESVIKDKENRIGKLQEEVDQTYKKAKTEATHIARQIVINARRDTETLVQNIKQHKADHESVKVAKKSFETKLKRLDKKIKRFEPEPLPQLRKDQVVKDMSVKISSLEESGRVLQLPDKQDHVLVEVNGIRIRVKLNDLAAVEPPKKKKEEQSSGRMDISRPDSFQIDLRGKRVFEALEDIAQFMDRSLMAGLTGVHILHGKGTGALQESIHEYLRTQDFVSSFQFARPEQGGAGITIVEFR